MKKAEALKKDLYYDLLYKYSELKLQYQILFEKRYKESYKETFKNFFHHNDSVINEDKVFIRQIVEKPKTLGFINLSSIKSDDFFTKLHKEKIQKEIEKRKKL